MSKLISTALGFFTGNPIVAAVLVSLTVAAGGGLWWYVHDKNSTIATWQDRAIKAEGAKGMLEQQVTTLTGEVASATAAVEEFKAKTAAASVAADDAAAKTAALQAELDKVNAHAQDLIRRDPDADAAVAPVLVGALRELCRARSSASAAANCGS